MDRRRGLTGARTRGQGPALDAVGSMIRAGRVPHALLLAGPPSVGKTTLALDLAAGLLCTNADPDQRPCRACRGCHLVESGNHPDLHRLAPDGPGGQIAIGRVRALSSTLALLPVEGGARVAIISAAQRLNEDAQNALLKTLEEPPSGVVLILCADEEERLLPTIRSRCARLRLGPVASRAIEDLLGELDIADAPTAARLARLASGRPGLALAYARAPEAAAARAEIARTLLDLLVERPAVRLKASRELLDTAGEAVLRLATVGGDVAAPADQRPGRKGRRVAQDRPSPEAAAPGDAGSEDAAGLGVADGQASADGDASARASGTAAERRRAAAWLVDAWRDLTRDLAAVGFGDMRGVRDPELLEELESAARRLPPLAAGAFLARLADAAGHLDVNVSPQLEIDVLALTWPRLADAA
jgi:DNA polymerase-3 subunit delta'